MGDTEFTAGDTIFPLTPNTGCLVLISTYSTKMEKIWNYMIIPELIILYMHFHNATCMHFTIIMCTGVALYKYIINMYM